MRTLDEWVKEYEHRTKEHLHIDPHNMVFNADKGFLQYAIKDNFRGKKAFIVNAVCGDGLFWEKPRLKVCEKTVYKSKPVK